MAKYSSQMLLKLLRQLSSKVILRHTLNSLDSRAHTQFSYKIKIILIRTISTFSF